MPTPQSEYFYAWSQNLGTITYCSFNTGDGVPVGSYLDPNIFTVSMEESQQTNWSIPVSSPYGKHSPWNQVSGWGEHMDLHKLMIAHLTYGGMPFDFIGLGTNYSQSRNQNSNMMEFQWQGKDLSQKLFVDGITMPSLRNTMASTAVIEMLGKGGIGAFDLADLYTDDFKIPVMHRQNGKLIDWIMQILEIRFLSWNMTFGGIFRVYRTGNTPPSISWRYYVNDIIESRQDTVSIQPITNQVIVIRAAENSEVVSADSFYDGKDKEIEQEPDAPGTEVNEFQQYTVNFDPPLNSVHWRIVSAEGGVFSDFLCFTVGDGNSPTSVRDPRPASTIPQASAGFGATTFNPQAGNMLMYTPAQLSNGALNNITKITFTWGEAPGNVIVTKDITGIYTVTEGSEAATAGYGRIEFIGTRGSTVVAPPGPQPGGGGQTENEGIAFDPVFRVVANNIQSQQALAARGAPNNGIRSIELDANPLIPDSKVAQEYANRYLQRTGRQFRESNFTVPLHPLLEPGQWVTIVDVNMRDDLGYNRDMLVTSVSHTFSVDPGSSVTSFRAIEYQY